MTIRRALFGFGLAAIFGISVFLALAWNATTITETDRQGADRRAEIVRQRYPGRESLLTLSSDGAFERRDPAPAARPGAVTHLFVLAYGVREQRLVEVDIPFWFYKMKAPAAGFALNLTGIANLTTFDLDDLGVTAADLERFGPGLVVDVDGPDGERLLIWTE
jgi:hypothetical protein